MEHRSVSLRRPPVPAQLAARTYPKPLPAPVLGWVSSQNQASAKAGTAVKLDGWFPTERGIRLLGGANRFATASEAGEPIESLMAYVGGTRKLFAGVDGNLINITTPADADTEPAADVSGQASNYYSSVNYVTAGGFYMYAVNGDDDPQLYDGSSWLAINALSTPAITGVTSSKLSQVNAFKNRLFFVEKNSFNVWATPADSLGGAMIQISLAGIYKRGGSVLFTATWSLDAGDGLDDKLVIVSTEGEVAIYQGIDPSDPDNWAMVGLYECPAPLGKNAFMRAGGDLLILTEQGSVPVSEIITKDPAALAFSSVSRQILPDWTIDASERRSLPWEIAKWPSRQMAMVTTPKTTDAQAAQSYIVNLQNGAWCKRTGWEARCVVLHDDILYFGTGDGRVLQADTGGTDDGEPYTCSAVLAWDHLGAAGYDKNVVSMRGRFIASTPFNPQLSVSTDYVVALPPPPNAAADPDTSNTWDTALWDDAVWDIGASREAVNTRWISVAGNGEVVGAQLQVTIGSTIKPDVEFVSVDMLFERGEVMV